MPHPDLAVVTGAFSYTGRYVTRRLLDQGVRVRTLTRSPHAKDPFGGRVEAAPLDFSDPDGLSRSMQGAGVFYNTYWVRYAHGSTTFDLAVENTGTLFEAAERAGVGRIVHFSVTNPSSESALPYFRGKAGAKGIPHLRTLGDPAADRTVPPPSPRPGPPAPRTTIPLRSPLRQPSTFSSAGITRSASVRWKSTPCSLLRTSGDGLHRPDMILERWSELTPARRATSFWRPVRSRPQQADGLLFL